MKKIFKGIYKLLPFKKQIFTVLKSVWKPSHSIYQHLYFQGVIKVDIDSSHSFKINHHGFELENEIFWRGLSGGWERVSNNLWITLSKNANVVLDIGANTGLFSLITKAVNPHARVFAFEPVNRVFDKLEGNVSLNNFDISCVRKAVSNKDGEAVIYDSDEAHIYSVTVNKNMFEGQMNLTERKIETISLDTFIRENNLSSIDLIKIDVETHEPEVLEGFSDFMQFFKPTILIEVLNDEVGIKINQLVDGMGYLYFNIDENKGIRQVEQILKSDYYNYLLCDEKTAKALKLMA